MTLHQPSRLSTGTTVGAELRATLVYALAAIVALGLQTTVLHALTGGRVIPDLVLILCVYLGLHEHSVGGATGAFLLGYLLDSFSGSMVGLNAFAMTSVYVVTYLMSRRLWMDNALAGVAMVVFGTFLKGVVIIGALAAYLSIDRLSLPAAETLIAEAVFAAALTPAVFAVLGWQRRMAGLA